MRHFVLIAGAIALAACQPAAKDTPPFEPALEAHIQSIYDRDLDAYSETITKGERLPLILPNGTMLTTREQSIDLHREWFSDKDWVQKQEVIYTHVNGEMAYATIRYSYQDTNDGPPRFTYLGLVFEVQDGAWRLIHDQNTRIQDSSNQ